MNEVFDLFIDLDASEEQLDFPVLYGSGRGGWMSKKLGEKTADLEPLFQTILQHIPAPKDDPSGPLQFRVTSLDWSDFVGRIAIGRVHRGKLEVGARVVRVTPDGKQQEVVVRGIYTFSGMTRVETQSVDAGDLAAVYGVDPISIGDSLTALEHVDPLPAVAIDEPTMSILMRVNDSPFAGRDGKSLTSRHLRDRLDKELRTNVALRVEQGESSDLFVLSGRGIMHLGFLLETMRREGFEFAAGKPQVIYHEENGRRLEPIEYLTVDAPEECVGKVIEILGERKAELANMSKKGNFQRLEFTVPARGLIGVRNRLLNATQGRATMHHVFHGYGDYRGEISGRGAGVMVAMAPGRSTFYALDGLRDRGQFFLAEGVEIYEGMIVGEHCKEGDIVVNLSREKKLTNVRSSTKEQVVKMPPPREFGVEEGLEYVEEDELVEVTPNHIRLRKILLNEKDRKRQDREEAKV